MEMVMVMVNGGENDVDDVDDGGVDNDNEGW